MVKVLTDCSKCIHSRVCSYRLKAENLAKEISDAPYNGYDISIMSDHYHISVDVYCNNFVAYNITPKTRNDCWEAR